MSEKNKMTQKMTQKWHKRTNWTSEDYIRIDSYWSNYFRKSNFGKGLGKEQNVTVNVTKDVTKELTERQKLIIELIKNNALVTIPEMSQKTGVVIRTIKRDIEDLQSKGVLAREGGRKGGRWIIKQLTKWLTK